MNSSAIQSKPVDSRIVLFNVFIQIVAILGIAVFVKLFLIDTTAVRSKHMSPTIEAGDHIVYFRGISRPPLNWLIKPGPGMPVVFSQVVPRDMYGCLRIRAIPGDSIRIENGAFINMHHPKLSVQPEIPEESILPGDYSPRDEMDPFSMPEPGWIYSFDSLSQRDFFFAVSMLKQENPDRNFEIKANLYIDNALMKDYTIPDFSMYHGSISAIPDSLKANWFFWDRLREYLYNRLEGKSVVLFFQVFDGERQIFDYQVRKIFVFLIGDNWTAAYDSRYFGPVCVDRIKGVVFGVLWSFGPDEKSRNSIRTNRILRIIF
jgi:hypothetical protein